MEGRNRTLSFGFPGYERRFPKATRSSRGRGDGVKKSNVIANDATKDMHSFELLATVAGQLLQERKEEAPQSIEASKENVETEANKEVEFIESSPCPSIAGQKELKNASSDQVRNPSETVKVSSNPRLILPKSELLHDQYSVISCFDHPDLLMPHESDANATMIYSSRRKRNSETSSCCQKAAADIVPFRMLIKPETGETGHTCKPSQLSTSAIMHSYSLKEADIEKHMMSAAARQCEEINLMIQNSFHDVVDAESPPLLSSGSSEETLSLMEAKYDSTTAVESKRQHVGIQNFSASKGGLHEDGKSSAFRSLITELSDTSFKPLIAKSSNSGTKKQEFSTAVKQKRRRMEDGEKDEKDRKRRGSKARTGRKETVISAPILDKKAEQLSSLNIVIDAEQNTNMLSSPTKIEKDLEKPESSSSISSPRKSTTRKSGDHVKFSIQSFMVPELSVNLPESATIANLKKAVMDAAMNLLGGGLCVRVLLQGKKVVDETESLLQAGISNGGKLGFMLEPNPMSTTTSMEDAFLVLSHGNNQTPLRYQSLPKGNEVNNSTLHMGTSGGLVDIEPQYSSGTDKIQSTMPSPNKQDISMHDANGVLIPSSSCALILHPTQANNGLNGLAVVPFGQSANNKRRIRRPFSVAEVELLVQAVEELGTGRWRDVKLHAFPQAKHRTYVDLKDKWKTLVHTASIAPHQRRGETVPQTLLDRVIQAHSHWTAQQSKQQSPEESKVVL